MKINWSDNNSITILDRARPEMIDLEPFPHLVIKEALPISYYKALYNEFPNKDLYVDENNIGSNKYFWFKSIDLLNEPSIPKIWRNFARVHTSNAFFQKIVLLFGNTIKLAYPHVFNQKSLNEIRTSVRGSNLSSDLELDCQPTYCSPVLQKSSISREAHLDREVALFAGLLYFKLEEDNTKGGNFTIYKVKPKYQGTKLVFDNRNHIDKKFISEYKTIPYEANTLIFFINSPLSIHGVTKREVTNHARLHVNFIGQTANKVFFINKPDQNLDKNNEWYGNSLY